MPRTIAEKKQVNNRLAVVRTARLLEQEELANLIGVKPITIKRIEAGQLQGYPKISTLKKLCQVLQVQPWHIYPELEIPPEADLSRQVNLPPGIVA